MVYELIVLGIRFYDSVKNGTRQPRTTRHDDIKHATRHTTHDTRHTLLIKLAKYDAQYDTTQHTTHVKLH